MELKKFIAETIGNILAGVVEAQSGPHGTHVNPQLRNAENVKWSGGLAAAGTGNVLSVVTFDVVVTVTDEADAGGKISVLGVGMQGRKKAETVVQNRIQFAVPMELPKPAQP